MSFGSAPQPPPIRRCGGEAGEDATPVAYVGWVASNSAHKPAHLHSLGCPRRLSTPWPRLRAHRARFVHAPTCCAPAQSMQSNRWATGTATCHLHALLDCAQCGVLLPATAFVRAPISTWAVAHAAPGPLPLPAHPAPHHTIHRTPTSLRLGSSPLHGHRHKSPPARAAAALTASDRSPLGSAPAAIAAAESDSFVELEHPWDVHGDTHGQHDSLHGQSYRGAGGAHSSVFLGCSC